MSLQKSKKLQENEATKPSSASMELFENIEHEEEVQAGDGNRGHWENPCDFFVSCLGYAVGLGNIWRFPLLCFKHGGGSFLVHCSFTHHRCKSNIIIFLKIPYILMLFGAGLPIFFLEMALGQYAGVGPIKIFGRIAPILQGLGYVSLFLSLKIRSNNSLLRFFFSSKKGCGLCRRTPCIFLQCCCLLESLVPGRLFQFATIARISFGMGVL